LRSFFDAMPRTGAPGYVPTDDDILRTRVRSVGVQQEVFKVRGTTLKVFDVGGQRSERKKWYVLIAFSSPF
jgi:guanine nucleotide-binding protein G(i) subunit alpha